MDGMYLKVDSIMNRAYIGIFVSIRRTSARVRGYLLYVETRRSCGLIVEYSRECPKLMNNITEVRRMEIFKPLKTMAVLLGLAQRDCFSSAWPKNVCLSSSPTSDNDSPN